MTPSLEQIKAWARRDGDGWVRIPESAWDGLVWCLARAEEIETALGRIQEALREREHSLKEEQHDDENVR